MIDKICKLQDEVNSITSGKDWREKELLWTFAIDQETSELIESLNLKWWKGTAKDIKEHSYKDVIETTGMDYQNCIIEMVDLLHFLISYLQVQYTDEEIVDMFDSSVAAYFMSISAHKIGSAEFKLAVFYAARAFSNKPNVNNFIALVYSLGTGMNKISSLYLGKNILNRFRQDNGYKEGTYSKIWDGKEDNEVMYYAVDSGVNSTELYGYFERYYNGLS